jgi:tetratricopeptide (TPR) repeat protein
MALFVYLEQRLLPPLGEMAGRRWGRVGAWGLLAAEMAAVGGFVLLITRVMNAPYVPGVETALAFGACYAVSMEYLLKGRVLEVAASLVTGASFGGGRDHRAETRDLAYADSLVARGRIEEATFLYRRLIEARPAVAAPYLRLARVLEAQKSYEGAVDALEACLRRAALQPQQEAFVVRQTHEMCERRLGDGGRARAHLERLLQRQPEGDYAAWARATLAGGHGEDVAENLAEAAWPELDPSPYEIETERRLVVDADFQVHPEQRVEGLVTKENGWRPEDDIDLRWHSIGEPEHLRDDDLLDESPRA